MKKVLYLLLFSIIASCGLLKQSPGLTGEEEFIVSRKFVGVFIDYRYTAPEDLAGQHIIWIKTTMENEYGKISASGRKCDFAVGDRLYIKRTFYDPGIGKGYWVYHIENDSGVSYEATEFQHDHKITIEKIFQSGF